MTYKLFIDDEREPPRDGFDWIIARTFDQVKEIFESRGIPDFISFDHDLGAEEQTGYDIANWIVDRDLDGFTDLNHQNFGFYVHSQNPIGKRNIQSKLHQYLNWKEFN